MSVKTVIESFAEKLGIGDDELNAMLAEGVAESVDLSQPLPGEAAEAFEVYLPEAGEELANQTKDGLMWYPMIRAGQWAVRPGPKGQKVRRKLKIVEGHSNDSRKELGLSDLLAAFQDEAVENVTVPTSHDNKTLENTGFIRKMKIDDMEVQKGPMKGKKVKAATTSPSPTSRARSSEALSPAARAGSSTTTPTRRPGRPTSRSSSTWL
jgi:hypothetical protein